MLGVCAGASDDAEHGATGTVARISGATQIAISAAGVDLADNALAYERSIGRLFDAADELMSDRSAETGIAARDFEICVANSREDDAHERFVVTLRPFYLAD